MAEGSTYVTLADLGRWPSSIEEDVPVEGVGTFRVRALSQAEITAIAQRVRKESDEDTYDGGLERQYYVAYGVVQPALGATEDLDAALERARVIGRSVPIFQRLYAKIAELTYSDSTKQLERYFFGIAGSQSDAGGSASGSSS
ncbi:MAG: hypothetical protein AB7R89_06220 [Dehalococcoidia bacterium]